MPWATPTLREVRSVVRDYVRAHAAGRRRHRSRTACLRVLADNQGALCHLNAAISRLAGAAATARHRRDRMARSTRRHLAGQCRRHHRPQAGDARSRHRRLHRASSGTVVPHRRARLDCGGSDFAYETTAEIIAWHRGRPKRPVRAHRSRRRRQPRRRRARCRWRRRSPASTATPPCCELTGGTDTETDDQLRARILHRIQNPPMGGAQADYVTWALAVPGVTRAWAAPEQGPGTITVRFLMDDLRADDDGWPTPADVQAVVDLHRQDAAGHREGLLRARADQAVHRHRRSPIWCRTPPEVAGRDRGERARHAARDGSARADHLRGVGLLRDHERARRAVVPSGHHR